MAFVGRVLSPAAKICVAMVVVAIATLSLGYVVGPEHLWLLALAEYAPYPVFLLPAIGSAVASALLGWRWRAAALAALIVVVTYVMGGEYHRPLDRADTFRVMTYNVKDYITLERSGGWNELAREIAAYDPDILALQDARAIADDLHSPAVRALIGAREVYGFGQYVIASRFPLRDCAPGEITFRRQAHTFVSCRVLAGDTTFDLISAHFITPRFGLSATRANPLSGVSEWRENISDRLVQARRLADDIRHRSRPLLVVGDLNAPNPSLVVRTLLDTGLRDAFAVAGTGFGYTWGHSLRFRTSFLRIDHILVGHAFGVANCVVGSTASQHRPVIADVFPVLHSR